MKLVISRKGFDSSNGGMPSPIYPDDKICSLPIPATQSPAKVGDLRFSGYDIANVISNLSKGKIVSTQHVHLDPDVDYQLLADRSEGWKGAFGQVGAAQKHLSNAEVGRGDIFIYFGWFREVEQHNQVWRFKPNSPDLHVIYGWLLVDAVMSVFGKEKEILSKHPWLSRHPHMSGINDSQNTIYVGAKNMPSTIGSSKPGYGVFRKLNSAQILTDTVQGKRSVWKLPVCFYPKDDRPPLSYHANSDRWKLQNDKWVRLNSVGRGQEFVLDTKYYPGVSEWLNELLG